MGQDESISSHPSPSLSPSPSPIPSHPKQFKTRAEKGKVKIYTSVIEL